MTTHPNELAQQRQDRALVRFLRANLATIRQDEAAAEIHRQFRRLRIRVERVIDNHDPEVYCGPCDAPAVDTTIDDSGTVYLETRTCGADLMANLGDDTVTCRACGIGYEVSDRREFMLAAARDMYATATVIANGLTGLNIPVTPSMVRQMAYRREILPMPSEDPAAAPYYLVGDVADVLTRRAERKAARMAGHSGKRKAS